jgi:pimeloyl-ACP methyl ester carboxylesterase
MPLVENAGIPIHYQVEGTGPPLVLQHGATDCLQTWYERGYVTALKQNNHLILIDARGHGASGKPHDSEAYAQERVVSDVVRVLDHLGIQTARYFGYSLGGVTGYAMARYAPERIEALILGGASAYAGDAGNSDPKVDEMLKAFQCGASALPSFFGEFLTPELEARLLANDMEALIAWRRRRMTYLGFEDILGSIHTPTLLFAGEIDPILTEVRSCCAQIPGATFVSLPGLNHIATMCRGDLVLPHVLQFLDELGGD